MSMKMLSACQNDARTGTDWSEPKSQHKLFPRKRVIRKPVDPLDYWQSRLIVRWQTLCKKKEAFWCSIYSISHVEALLVFRVQIFASSFFCTMEWELSLQKAAAVNNIITASKTYSLHVQHFSVSFTVAFQSMRTLHPIILFSVLEAVFNDMLWYFTDNVRFVHTWLKKWAITFWLFTHRLSTKYEMIKKYP